MREGIFVKDLLHRGPASESGRIYPGDRIASVKISFRCMVYEDALTILSYASPYDVELEVESGGSSGAGSRPTTLLKKTIGPSPSRICHPLYRSQSIPELSQAQHKTTAKRLFIADPNESLNSNYSTINSTVQSSKITPSSHMLERHHEEAKPHDHHYLHNHQQQQQKNHHHKFGIKVLPALDGTVHRIENQNEHNTNLERRNSRKMDMENETGQRIESNSDKNDNSTRANDHELRIHYDAMHNAITERYRKRENPRQREPATIKCQTNNVAVLNDSEINTGKSFANGHDVTDLSSTSKIIEDFVERFDLPSEVPTEVHNAAMAARRNRKNSMEMLNPSRLTIVENFESTDHKSPQKNKRKAPAPPIVASNDNEIDKTIDSANGMNNSSILPGHNEHDNPDDIIESITDYVESLNDYVGRIRDNTNDKESLVERSVLNDDTLKSRKTEIDSDNDSEIHDSFTTIELQPADITIHQTPTPQDQLGIGDNHNEAREADAVETDDIYRKAASLGDLSKYEDKSLVVLERAQSLDMADTGSKKRKPVTSDDINELTEDLTKIEDADSFDRRKLKKSNEWGKLEDAIWKKTNSDDDDVVATRSGKRSGGTLERSRSAIGMKLKNENDERTTDSSGRILPFEMKDDTSMELYNLPLSIRLTREFVRTERMFNPDEDNSLARIVNNGRIVKSRTPDEIELDFRRATPESLEGNNNSIVEETVITKMKPSSLTISPSDNEFGMALRYFDNKPSFTDLDSRTINDDNLTNLDDKRDDSLYAGKTEVQEEPMKKKTVAIGCPGCDRKYSHHDHNCGKRRWPKSSDDTFNRDNADWQPQEVSKLPESPNNDDKSLSAFKIGLTRFDRNCGEPRPKSVSPMESKIEKKLLREQGIDVDNLGESKGRKNLDDSEGDEDEEGYDFGSEIMTNSETLSSPVIDRYNVSNVSVSSGENSEDSGLVGESGDYSHQDSDSKPPLPETSIPISSSQQKLTYIAQINVSTSKDDSPISQQDRVDVSTKKGKPARNDGNLTANEKANSVKKPPVPPRRNDASKIQSRDTGTSDKQVVYVSEYKSSTGKDKNKNTAKISTINHNDGNKASGNEKFKNWIYLDDSKDQKP